MRHFIAIAQPFSLTGCQKVTYKNCGQVRGQVIQRHRPPHSHPQAPTPPKLVSQSDVVVKEGHVPIQESGVVSLQHHHGSPGVLFYIDLMGSSLLISLMAQTLSMFSAD